MTIGSDTAAGLAEVEGPTGAAGAADPGGCLSALADRVEALADRVEALDYRVDALADRVEQLEGRLRSWADRADTKVDMRIAVLRAELLAPPRGIGDHGSR